jgi:hypothetical protein
MNRKEILRGGSVIRFEEEAKPAVSSGLAPAAPTKRPRGTDIIRIAKIDPEKRRAAILPISANMRVVRQMVGKHVGEQLVTSIDDLHVRVCCETIGKGKIWRVRGSLPVRGRAILYGFAGFGPSDFPGSSDWLKRMIEFEPEGVDRAINDERDAPDAAA